jgi:methionyl-tRNA formyltransferase
MKIAIVGQQDFGKAGLEAFLARGDTVAGVFCAPEKPGARPDVLKVAAQEKGLKVHQFKSLRDPKPRKRCRTPAQTSASWLCRNSCRRNS